MVYFSFACQDLRGVLYFCVFVNPGNSLQIITKKNLVYPTVISAIEEAGGISKYADLTKIKFKRKLPGELITYKKTNLNFKNLLSKSFENSLM